MIKAGDKEKLYKRELIDELINKLRGAVLTGDTIYLLEKFVATLNMHEQQKQRADELEKRWSELRKRLIETCKADRIVAKQYSRSFLCLLDELEGKENVFETVQQLEGDDNARSK